MEIKYSVIIGFLGQLRDRFATYHQPLTLEERIVKAADIQGVRGIEVVYPQDVHNTSYAKLRDILSRYELEVSSLNVNVKSEAKFHHGAFTSIDPGVRKEAIDYLRNGMTWAKEVNAHLVTVCPLADGHDYPFEMDYRQAWAWLIEGFGEAAESDPAVDVAIEYKKSEPRARVIVPNVGTTLYLCQEIGLDNLGVTVDIGHAHYADETPAQALILAAFSGRLLLVHINDNYRNWDWDLVPGSVNYWDWLEVLYVLEETGYHGWLVSDVFPSRSDPVETLSMCYRSILHGLDVIQRLKQSDLKKNIEARASIKTLDLLQSLFMTGKDTK